MDNEAIQTYFFDEISPFLCKCLFIIEGLTSRLTQPAMCYETADHKRQALTDPSSWQLAPTQAVMPE